LKIEAGRPLPTIAFGTSADLMVGEPVIAIGNAYGYEHHGHQRPGVVQGPGRGAEQGHGLQGADPDECPDQPRQQRRPADERARRAGRGERGDPGGAQNIGFALPIDFVIGRAADLLGGRRRGGLRHGLTLKDAAVREAPETIVKRTVTVQIVDPTSAAGAAGFKAGDVIEAGRRHPGGHVDRPGAGVPGEAGRRQDGGEGPARRVGGGPGTGAPAAREVGGGDPGGPGLRKLGAKFLPVGAEAVARANPQLHGGLLVTEVSPGSASAIAGLAEGDILVGLHQWETITADNVAFVLNHKDFGSFLPLKVFSAGTASSARAGSARCREW